MNVRVKDEKNNDLSIVRIESNKPLYKEFYVKLSQPVKPGRQIKELKLNYDWEEPDREYAFDLPTDCKNFNFKLIVPNDIHPRGRFFKRVGFAERQPLEPKIIPKKEHTEMLWEGKNLHSHDEYIFQW